MDFRHGTCSACRASFRIPVSFQADKAKCSKCGGVVQIGPPTSDAASERHSGSPGASAGSQAARSSTRARTSTARSSVAESSSDPDRHHAKHSHRDRNRGLPLALKVTLAIVAPILALAAYVGYQWSVAAEEDQKRVDQARADQEAIDKQHSESIRKQAEADAKKLAEEANAIANASKKPAAVEDTAKPVAAAKPAPKPVEGFDLSTIPDFGPAPNTTPEQWKEMQTLAATFADFEAGRAAMVAGNKLEASPKLAFPALLNQLKKQNLESDHGQAIALSFVKTLERICPSHTIRWRSNLEKDWLKHDQRAIKAWCDLWTQGSQDAAYWDKVTKPRPQPPEKKVPPGGQPAKPDDGF